MALATSYNVTANKGAKENLENVLKTVEPTETPLYSTLSQSAAPKATLNEWLVDNLESPEIGGTIDGVDLSLSAGGSTFKNLINSRERLHNRVQTFRDLFAVSRQAEMVDVAPGGSLFAASQAKSLLQLKRSIETGIGSRVTISLLVHKVPPLRWRVSGFGPDPTATGNTFTSTEKEAFRAVSGSRVSLASLTESAFRGLLQAVYTAAGSKGTYNLFCGPAVMNKITDYTRSTVADGNFSFDQDVSGKTLVRSILTYVSDYSTINIIPDLFLGRVDGSASGTDTVEGTS